MKTGLGGASLTAIRLTKARIGPVDSGARVSTDRFTSRILVSLRERWNRKDHYKKKKKKGDLLLRSYSLQRDRRKNIECFWPREEKKLKREERRGGLPF